MGFNVILFGETGAGKSSILNMLSDNYTRAAISSGARGCTFKSTPYNVTIYNATYTIYDTAGLDEGDAGRVPKSDAIIQLYQLVTRLKEGISLLVFCMRGPRIKEAAYKNWRLFYEVMCRKEVPIVIAITGLEGEDVMDNWWYQNKGAFQRYQMNPSGFACITATKGKMNRNGTFKFDEEYAESQEKMKRLIRNHHLERPWRVEPVEWFKEIVLVSYRSRTCRSPKEIKEFKTVSGEGLNLLVSRCEMSQEDAKALAEKLNSTA